MSNPHVQPPPILGLPDPQLGPRPPGSDEVAELAPEAPLQVVGRAASRGVRTGGARVVPPGTLLPEVAPGEILVAENAGPIWTPMFPILGGLVLDWGVLTDHAAITAREYGIPAVIGTGAATRRIPDGSWVTVDGMVGTVQLVQDGAGEVSAPHGDQSEGVH